MTQFFSTFWYVILLPLQGLLLWCCHVWFRINQILTHLHGCLVSPVPWIAPLYWQKAKIRSHIFPKMVPGWWSFAREMLLLQRQIKNFVRCVKKTSTFKQKTPSQMHPQFRFQFFHFFLTPFCPPTMRFCLLSTKSWQSPCHHVLWFTSRSFSSSDRSPAIPGFDHRGHPPSLSPPWAPLWAPPWVGWPDAAAAPTATDHRARGPWWKRSVSRKLRSVCPEHMME